MAVPMAVATDTTRAAVASLISVVLPQVWHTTGRGFIDRRP
jgi:hypothetical protein